MKTILRSITLIAVVAFLALPAYAGTCTCSDSTLLVAGGYSVFSSAAWQPSSQFAITCNGNATYDVTISTGSSGSFSSRTLRQGAGATLNYNIFTDASRSSVWGGTTRRTYNTSSGQTTFPDPLYFDFTAGQDVPFSGAAYTDTVAVTLVPASGTGGPTRSCTTTISTTVNAECLAPAATLGFGNYDPAGVNAATALDKSSSLLYQCTSGVSATVSLNNGANWNGTTRRMAGPGGYFLTYEIYRDAGRATIWNTINTMNATSTSKNTYLGGASGLVVYGRVPATQSVIAGAYTDSVTATVNY